MAIKGKGRTKARQPVRAPRREPVPVPVPLVRRRWVQLTAAFVAGLLIFMGGVWLTNGLRDQDEAERSTQQELERRRAGSAWQTLVESEVGKLGEVSFEAPPAILANLGATLDGLAERTPGEAAPTLRRIAADTKQVQDAVEGFALASQVGGKGFTPGEVLRYLSARDELVTALNLYREAAALGMAASRLDVEDRAPVLAQARELTALAQAALARFQLHQIEALNAAGIQPQQPGIPGLPGS
ncbi:MAG TPA: hypothetical protein VFZ75_03360 [Actinomycetota bacterium]|nr:hypothetical protein [Actinomycetota bacterium]